MELKVETGFKDGLDIDLESLEISDFMDETSLSSAEDLANVMAASSTTCECCCSVSTALVQDFINPDPTKGIGYFGSIKIRTQLQKQAESIGANGIASIEGEWRKLLSQVRSHQERGTDPKSAEVKKLAQHWQELVGKFTGGNARIATQAAKLYAGGERTLHDIFGEDLVPDAEDAKYIARALEQ